MWLTISSTFSKPFENNSTSTTLASSYKGITWNIKYTNLLEPIRIKIMKMKRGLESLPIFQSQ